jgi:phage shock protein E
MPFGFEKLVAEAKKKITEISPTEAAAKSKSGDAVIVDVREKDEWDEEHIPDAIHMSRGTIELDIEEKIPDVNAMIVCHCGGGGRSALAAENLQKMGYKNVRSMAGGFNAWKAAGLPTAKYAVYRGPEFRGVPACHSERSKAPRNTVENGAAREAAT